MTGHEKIKEYIPKCIKAGKEMIKKNHELVSQGKITQKEAEANEKLLNFMMSWNEDDYYDFFDNAIFYTIVESYIRMTASELVEEHVLNWGQSETVIQRIMGYFETVGGSKEVCAKY